MWATSSHTTPATLVNSHEGLWSPNDLSSVIAQVCHRLLLSVDVIDIPVIPVPVIPVQMQQDDMCTMLTSTSRAAIGNSHVAKSFAHSCVSTSAL
jgi:hypothetical protein